MKITYPLSILEIQEYLPHRSPFLLIDQILDIHVPQEEGKKSFPFAPLKTQVKAFKNVSYNEPYFQGHFPNNPVVPGVLILESMAQVSGFAAYPSFVQDQQKRGFLQCFLVKADQVRFQKPVCPGNCLVIESTLSQRRADFWVFDTIAKVQSDQVAQAQLMLNLKQVQENTSRGTSLS